MATKKKPAVDAKRSETDLCEKLSAIHGEIWAGMDRLYAIYNLLEFATADEKNIRIDFVKAARHFLYNEAEELGSRCGELFRLIPEKKEGAA